VEPKPRQKTPKNSHAKSQLEQHQPQVLHFARTVSEPRVTKVFSAAPSEAQKEFTMQIPAMAAEVEAGSLAMSRGFTAEASEIVSLLRISDVDSLSKEEFSKGIHTGVIECARHGECPCASTGLEAMGSKDICANDCKTSHRVPSSGAKDAALTASKLRSLSKAVLTFMKMLHADNDGKVSHEEFCHGVRMGFALCRKDSLFAGSAAFDHTGSRGTVSATSSSGLVSANKLHTGAAEVRTRGHLSADCLSRGWTVEAAKLMKLLDADQDGGLSRQEFRDGVQSGRVLCGRHGDCPCVQDNMKVPSQKEKAGPSTVMSEDLQVARRLRGITNDAAMLLELLDANKDGKLSRQEFEDGINKGLVKCADAAKPGQDSTTQADTLGGAAPGSREAASEDKSIARGFTAEAAKLMELLDVGHDGSLSLQEFREGIQNGLVLCAAHGDCPCVGPCVHPVEVGCGQQGSSTAASWQHCGDLEAKLGGAGLPRGCTTEAEKLMTMLDTDCNGNLSHQEFGNGLHAGLVLCGSHGECPCVSASGQIAEGSWDGQDFGAGEAPETSMSEGAKRQVGANVLCLTKAVARFVQLSVASRLGCREYREGLRMGIALGTSSTSHEQDDIAESCDAVPVHLSHESDVSSNEGRYDSALQEAVDARIPEESRLARQEEAARLIKLLDADHNGKLNPSELCEDIRKGVLRGGGVLESAPDTDFEVGTTQEILEAELAEEQGEHVADMALGLTAEIDALMAVVDADHDGHLHRHEFREGVLLGVLRLGRAIMSADAHVSFQHPSELATSRPDAPAAASEVLARHLARNTSDQATRKTLSRAVSIQTADPAEVVVAKALSRSVSVQAESTSSKSVSVQVAGETLSRAVSIEIADQKALSRSASVQAETTLSRSVSIQALGHTQETPKYLSRTLPIQMPTHEVLEKTLEKSVSSQTAQVEETDNEATAGFEAQAIDGLATPWVRNSSVRVSSLKQDDVVVGSESDGADLIELRAIEGDSIVHVMTRKSIVEAATGGRRRRLLKSVSKASITKKKAKKRSGSISAGDKSKAPPRNRRRPSCNAGAQAAACSRPSRASLKPPLKQHQPRRLSSRASTASTASTASASSRHSHGHGGHHEHDHDGYCCQHCKCITPSDPYPLDFVPKTKSGVAWAKLPDRFGQNSITR